MARSRSQASKRAWRTRKAKRAYKGNCPVCHKPVWVRGKRYQGRWYHKRCLTAKCM